MSDEQDRELLEQERRRFRMADDSYQQLERRRDRKRRNRMITSGVVALVIAAAGGTGVVLAFRNTGTESPAATSPPPTTASPIPTPTSSPSGGPVVAAITPPSGSIQFIDADHGWLVSGGDILASTDGGNTWTPIYTGKVRVTALQFVDGLHGWAIGGDLLRTVDGGKSWTDLASDGQPSVGTVQFVDANVGWAISDASGGAVLKTLDGGASWTEVPAPIAADSLCFIGTDGGWVAGGASVLRTTDGGENWQQTDLEIPQGEPWTATVSCSTAREAWTLLSDGGAAGQIAHVLYHSGDAGGSWQAVLQAAGTRPLGPRDGVYESEDPYPGPLGAAGQDSLAFVAWCPACNSVSLLRTTDGGTSWDRLEVAGQDKGGAPTGASFVDPDHGWVLFTAQTDAGPKTAVAIVVGSKVTISTVG